MVELIVGGKGKGKTKILLEKAAEAIKNANGSVVYVDKNNQHMYELSNQIRLVDITQYPVKGTEGFFGFLSGMIASNHDLEFVILDSFLTIARLELKELVSAVELIKSLSERYSVNFIISVSLDEAEIPAELKELISVAL
ncbi:MAG: twitching motility protein PilT [Eubacteriales bacterium]|nr:twitching motility protein PilT [Eubacteriales bacterium]